LNGVNLATIPAIKADWANKLKSSEAKYKAAGNNVDTLQGQMAVNPSLNVQQQLAYILAVAWVA